MKKIDVTGVPTEMVEALFGDENIVEGDEAEINLERLVETATGVSLSPYSQEKMMLSDQVSVPSSNAPMFSDIFGEGDIGADQTASIPQSSFIRASEISLDNHTRFIPDSTTHKTKLTGSLHNRFIAKVTEMASELSKTNVPSDLALLADQVLSSGDRVHLQYQIAKRKKLRKKFLQSLTAAMRKSQSFKFLMDKIDQEKPTLNEKERDELDQLRVIDTEVFDCEMLPSSS
jgi:hypothetical protein